MSRGHHSLTPTTAQPAWIRQIAGAACGLRGTIEVRQHEVAAVPHFPGDGQIARLVDRSARREAWNCTAQRQPNIRAPSRPMIFHGDMCRPVQASQAISLFTMSHTEDPDKTGAPLSSALHRLATVRRRRARSTPHQPLSKTMACSLVVGNCLPFALRVEQSWGLCLVPLKRWYYSVDPASWC